MQESLEQQVWDRADHCCEYCHMPQLYDELPFEIEHIIATNTAALTTFATALWPALRATGTKALISAALTPTPAERFGFSIPAVTNGSGISAG